MTDRTKQILVIILFIIAVILFGFFIYWFFWRPFLSPPTAEELEAEPTFLSRLLGGTPADPRTLLNPTDTLTRPSEITPPPTEVTPPPPVVDPRLSAFVDVPTEFSMMTQNGDIVYYNREDGKFYRIDAFGNLVALSDEQFSGASNAIFDPNGNKAVIEFPDRSKVVYDFNNKKQYILPRHWEDFGFSPTGQELVFKNMALDPENRFLVTSRFDGSSIKIIDTIGRNADKVTPNWSPNNLIVATYAESKDGNRTDVFMVGQNNENFRSLLVNGRDFRGLWSPDGSIMLYSAYDVNNDYKPQLWITSATPDAMDAGRQPIGLETWADRCTFSGSQQVFCSVPESMPFAAGMEPSLTNEVRDQIWSINIANGQRTLIAQPNELTKVNKIMASPENPDQIFLSDALTGKIYKLDL
jgi:hypothetical protein